MASATKLYFQTIPQKLRQGQLTAMRVRYTSTRRGVEGGSLTVGASARGATLTLYRHHTYWVTVDAATAMGYNHSLHLQPLEIPEEASGEDTGV